MLQRIQQAARDGNWDDLLQLAQQWAAQEKDNPQPVRWQVIALRNLQQSQQAQQQVLDALGRWPHDADLHFLHARLLLEDGQTPQAQDALQRSVQANPNQLDAYVLSAQLAMHTDQLDEARSKLKLAERIDAEHPQVLAAKGGLALRENDAALALRLLSAAITQAPDDAQILHALGFAYMANGHLAFAEQAFRKLLEMHPVLESLRMLLVQLMHAQGRVDDALLELETMIDAHPNAVGLLQIGAQMALQTGQHALALRWLEQARSLLPDNPAVWQLSMHAWQQAGQLDAAEAALEKALAAYPQQVDLWQIRVHLARVRGADVQQVLDRWEAHLDSDAARLVPMELRLLLLNETGQTAQADVLAEQILQINPSHQAARLRVVDGLMLRNPAQALQRIEQMLAEDDGEDGNSKRLLGQWRAYALQALGKYADAVAQWRSLHAAVAAQRAPLPALTNTVLPAPAQVSADATPLVFVFGLPGSRLDQLLGIFPALNAWRSDRFGPQPPQDPLQYLDSPARMAAGELSAATVWQVWQTSLRDRGVARGAAVIDWLPWWDNAWLTAFAIHAPQAQLIYSLVDPRQMLVNWLRGEVVGVPFALADILDAAKWLAQALQQIVQLRDANTIALHLLRLDSATPRMAAVLVGAALGIDVSSALPASADDGNAAAAEAQAEQGHWRNYAEALADAFALLTPVAVALGYSEH